MLAHLNMRGRNMAGLAYERIACHIANQATAMQGYSQLCLTSVRSNLLPEYHTYLNPSLLPHLASSMAAKELASVLAELNGLNELVASQIAAGMSRDDVVESLFRSWSDRLSRMKGLNTKQKGELTSAPCTPLLA